MKDISDFIKEINTKVSVKTSRVVDLKRYYLSMQRVYMVYLYDKGFISDPTVFKKEVFFQNIDDMQIKGLYCADGSILLSSRMVSYALLKNKEPEQQEFLTLLQKVLYYREACDSIDKVYENFEFSGSNFKKISFSLKRSGAKIFPKVGIPLDRANLACILPSGYYAKEISLHEYYWEIAMRLLEVPEEDWLKDGLFDSELSHKDEVEFMDILLDGNIKLDGKYTKKLEDWLYCHKWSNAKMTGQLHGLYTSVIILSPDETLDILYKKLNELDESGQSVIGITKGSIFVKEKIHTYNMPMSCFSVISGYDDDLTFTGNILNGYTGECYPAEYLLEEEINYVGCPIELNKTKKAKAYYYDLEQVDIHSISWFEDNSVELYFSDEYDGLKNPFEEGSLEHVIYDIYLDSLKGNLIGKISGDITYDDIVSAKNEIMKILNK